MAWWAGYGQQHRGMHHSPSFRREHDQWALMPPSPHGHRPIGDAFIARPGGPLWEIERPEDTTLFEKTLSVARQQDRHGHRP